MIHFERCFTRRTFFSGMTESASVPLREVQSIFLMPTRHGYFLTIATEVGKAYIPDGSDNFWALRDFLRGVCRTTPPARWSDHPLVFFAVMIFANAGILLGWFLTPVYGADYWLPINVVVGAVVAGLMPIAATWFASRSQR